MTCPRVCIACERVCMTCARICMTCERVWNSAGRVWIADFRGRYANAFHCATPAHLHHNRSIFSDDCEHRHKRFWGKASSKGKKGTNLRFRATKWLCEIDAKNAYFIGIFLLPLRQIGYLPPLDTACFFRLDSQQG